MAGSFTDNCFKVQYFIASMYTGWFSLALMFTGWFFHRHTCSLQCYYFWLAFHYQLLRTWYIGPCGHMSIIWVVPATLPPDGCLNDKMVQSHASFCRYGTHGPCNATTSDGCLNCSKMQYVTSTHVHWLILTGVHVHLLALSLTRLSTGWFSMASMFTGQFFHWLWYTTYSALHSGIQL